MQKHLIIAFFFLTYFIEISIKPNDLLTSIINFFFLIIYDRLDRRRKKTDR